MYLEIEVCSLTCLFVYKVLKQEVLDDRGKFEVSLWKNVFWKVEDKISEENTFILLTLSRTRSFSRACDKEYDPSTAFISGWEVSGLEENFKRSIMQASRHSQNRWSSGPRPGRVVWLGVKLAEHLRKRARSIENLLQIATSERCSRRSKLIIFFINWFVVAC